MCFRAFCDVAITTMSSANATLGKYHSSNRKPNYFPFFSTFSFSVLPAVSISRVNHGAFWRSLWEAPLLVLFFRLEVS